MDILSYSYKHFLEEGTEEDEDLSVFFGGIESEIAQGFRHGPYTHDYYDVNYIKRGAMTLTVNGRLVHVKENELFVVPPYAVVEQSYTGEDNSVVYFNVRGRVASHLLSLLGFSEQAIVFSHLLTPSAVALLDSIIQSLPLYTNFSVHREKMQPISYVTVTESSLALRLRRIGCFYQLMSELSHLTQAAKEEQISQTPQREYVKNAVKYIESQYAGDVSVEQIARHLGITRNYLHSLFRRELGISVQEYILRTRMRVACNLLKYESIPIKVVAASVGYEAVAFGHAFKNAVNISATEYRRQNQLPTRT